MLMAKNQLAFSAGSQLLPGIVSGIVWDQDGKCNLDDRKKLVFLERVKRLPTRPESLADFLRQCLTVDHLDNLKVATPILAQRAKRAGHGARRVPQVLKQLLAEAL